MSSSRQQTSIVPTRHHAFRQLKLVVPGLAITYYLGTISEFLRILQDTESPWGRTVALGGLGHGLATIALFVYVLMTPWIKGVEANYRSWRESGVLSSVIPVLTASIVIGWFLFVLTLGQWSQMGYLKGIIGVSSVYALTFGLLGLVPVPKVRQA
ncbi:hypothetical protein BD779DRAFT_1495579 [Infundibulicybe gibba]|nr:hypothetical protein BD779DRAFT_1495579 [Infundibulicybe gibba]